MALPFEEDALSLGAPPQPVARRLGYSNRGHASPAGSTDEPPLTLPSVDEERTAERDDASRVTGLRRSYDARVKEEATAARNAANNRREADFLTKGIKHYVDANGVIQAEVDEGGAPRYTQTGWKKTKDEATGTFALTRRNDQGKTETRAPKLVTSGDIKDPILYHDFGTGPQDREPVGHVDDLAQSGDPEIARVAAAHQVKRNAAIRKESLKPLQESANAATVALDNAKLQRSQIDGQVGKLQSQISALDANPAIKQTSGGFLGMGAEPTSEAKRLQGQRAGLQAQADELTKRSGELAAATDEKLGGQLHRAHEQARLELDAWSHQSKLGELGDLANQRRAILRSQGKPEADDPVLGQILTQQKVFGQKASETQQRRDQFDAESTAQSERVAAEKAGADEGQIVTQAAEFAKRSKTVGTAFQQLREDAASGRIAPQTVAKAARALLDTERDLTSAQRTRGIENAVARRTMAEGEELYAFDKNAKGSSALTAAGNTFMSQAPGYKPGGAPEKAPKHAALAQSPTVREAAKAAAFAAGDTEYTSDLYAKLPGKQIAINPAAFSAQGHQPPGAEKPLTWRDAIDQAAKQGALDPKRAESMRRELTVRDRISSEAAVDGALENDSFRRWVAVAHPELASINWLNLSPHSADFNVPNTSPELRAAAKEWFKADRSGEMILNATKQAGMGMIGVYGDIAKRLLPDDSAGSRAIGDTIEGLRQTAMDPRLDGHWTSVIAQGLGSSLAFGVPAETAGALARGLKVGATAEKWTVGGMIAATGGLSEGQQLYDEARQSGASKEVAEGARWLGTITGGTEAFGAVGDMMKRIGSAKAFGVGRAIRDAIADIGEETFQEVVLQQLPENVIAQKLYDANRQTFDGIADSAIGAGGSAAIMSVIASTVAGIRYHSTIGTLNVARQSREQSEAQLAETLARPEVQAVADMLPPASMLEQHFESLRAPIQEAITKEAAKKNPDEETMLDLHEQLAQVEVAAGSTARAVARNATDVAQAVAQAKSAPDYIDAEASAQGLAAGQPATANPATAGANRDGVTALVKVAAGTPLAQLTEGESQALTIIGTDLGSEMVRDVKGRPVITDKARDWALQQAPATARVLRQTEAEMTTAATATPPAASKRAKSAPAAKPVSSSTTNKKGANDETKVQGQGRQNLPLSPSAPPAAASSRAPAGGASGTAPVVAKTATTAPTEKPAVAPASLLPHFAKAMRARGASDAKIAGATLAVAKQVNAVVQRNRALFGHRIEVVDEPRGTGGFVYDTERDALVINRADLAADHEELSNNPARVEKLVREEAIHRAAVRLEKRGEWKAGALWESLSEPTQEAFVKAYNQGRGTAEGAATTNSWAMGHEMVRMLVQGRLSVHDGKLAVDGASISEETASPTVVQKLGDILRKIRDYFTDLAGSLRKDGNQQPAIEEVDRVVDLVTRSLKALETINTPASVTPVAENTAATLAGESIKGEWKAFAPESGTLGVPRTEMPQFQNEHLGALTQFLSARGIAHTTEEVLPGTLKPTQHEYSYQKVGKLVKMGQEGTLKPRSILVSADNYVLDRHHQYVAALHHAPDTPLQVIRFHAPIQALFDAVQDFPQVEYAGGSAKASASKKPETKTTPAAMQPAAPAVAPTNAALSQQVSRALAIPLEQVGKTETVTHKGRTVTTVNAVIEAEAANTSHNPDDTVSRGYPQALQPRDRRDPIYVEQQRKIAANPNWAEEMLTGTPDRGTPIMAMVDGFAPVTIIGNGRANAKALMYSAPDLARTAGEFRQEMAKHAAEKGIAPAAVAKVKNPVFVRFIVDPLSIAELRSFSQASNEFSGAATNAVEQGRVDASKLTPQVLAHFNPDYDLDAAKNDDFRREFVRSVIGRSENITGPDLRRRVQASLFAKAYGDTEAGMAAFARLAGEDDEGVRNLVRAMLDVAPAIAAVQQRIAAGTLHPVDIAPALTRAVQEIAVALRERPAAQSADVALEGLVNQAELTPRDALDQALLEFLVANRRTRSELVRGLSNYVAQAYAAGDPRQVDMFGAGPPTALETFRAALASDADPQAGARRQVASKPGRYLASSAAELPGDERLLREGGVREFAMGEFRVTRAGGRERLRLFDALWPMYERVYGRLGDRQYKNRNQAYQDNTLFDLYRNASGTAVAFSIKKITPYGYKGTASGTDGSKEGKMAWRLNLNELFEAGNYSELSERPLEIAIEVGLKMVPISEVGPILAGKTITPDPDGFSYKRAIGGLTKEKLKRMVGWPILWKQNQQPGQPTPQENSGTSLISSKSSSAATSAPSAATTSWKPGATSAASVTPTGPTSTESSKTSAPRKPQEPVSQSPELRSGRAAPADDLFAWASSQPDNPAAPSRQEVLSDQVFRDLFGSAEKQPAAAPAKPQPAATVAKPAAPDQKAAASEKIADHIFDRLRASRGTTWQQLFALADARFSGTQAAGTYTVKDAYDALELGINNYIRWAKISPDASPDAAVRNVSRLKAMLTLVPTQTKRTPEMDEFQQFSTVPPLAYAANWVAAPRAGETYVEPSAGVGGLAVFGQIAGAKVYANELSQRRANLLKTLGGFEHVFTENAEQLDNILPPEVQADVVVMNPPFSATAGRLAGSRDTANAAVHIEQALKRLKPGGRLVAIVGEGMAADRPTFRAWWAKIGQRYAVRANIGVSGAEYVKYGTTFDNQLVVIDAVPPGSYGETITGRVDKVEDLIPLLTTIRDERPTSSPSVPGSPGGNRSAQRSAGDVDGGKTGGAATQSDAGSDRGSNGAQRSGVAGSTQPNQRPVAGGAADRGVGAGSDAGLGGSGELSGLGAPAGGDAPAVQRGAGSESDVTYGKAEAKASGELTDKTFDAYKPRIVIPGATMPPVKLDESAAMASVDPITPTYKLAIPREFIVPAPGEKEGRLSAVALESIILAGNAHQEMIPAAYTDDERTEHVKRFGKEPPAQFRGGFFIGDGTGAGKGRQAVGIILDNWKQGRRKALWISEKSGLYKDARRDARDVAGMEDKVFEVRKVKAADRITQGDGIAFVSYSTLRSKAVSKDPQAAPKSRVDQLVTWLGEDFDGALIFDESHNMAKNAPMKGSRGVQDASQQALAGVELQRRLPNARVTYLSATGATEVSNLGYADRLGIWGPGTPFANKRDFTSKISAGGVAAMELVARDLKAMGRYLARSLSWDGVTYDRVEHKLTGDQREVYDALAEGWQVALRNMNDALKITGAVKVDDSTGSEKVTNSDAKKNMMGKFWGAHQRFFNQVISSMKMPTIISAIEREIAQGNAVVVQLVNTNQAAMERALAAKSDAEDTDLEDLDMTPRDQLIQMVESAFPVVQHEEYTDEEGNVRSRPVKDSAGNPVLNRQAVAMRDALIEKLASIRVPDGPLEILLNEIGKEKVAEVTGRTRRVVWGKDEKGATTKIVEKRQESQRDVEAQEFQDDKRSVLVFSQAGGTGRSYHADLKAKNQRKRIHILLQPGWEASKAVQGFGRTHRNNQKQPPHYALGTTDIPGERRFMSSIARRLDQLGALTKGERKTGSQGIFNAADNLESQQAKDALYLLFQDVMSGRAEGINLADFTEQMGLKLVDKDGQALRDLPPITQFLNRLLSLKLDLQAKVFDAFEQRHQLVVEKARDNGTLDVGMETVKALSTKVVSEKVINKDARTGATTSYVELDLTLPTSRTPWSNAIGADVFVNVKTGKIFMGGFRSSATLSDGRVVDTRYMYGVTSKQQVRDAALAEPAHWRKLSASEAETEWQKQYDAAPKTHVERAHLLTGTLLNVWDRLTGNPRVVRVQTDDGRRMIGRRIDEADIADVLSNFGVDQTGNQFSAKDVAQQVLDQGATARLANGWTIKRKLVSGGTRLELIGPTLANNAEMDTLGVTRERIQYNTRYFIPIGGRTEEIIKQLTSSRPVTELSGGSTGDLPAGRARYVDPDQLQFEELTSEELAAADRVLQEATRAHLVSSNVALADKIAAQFKIPGADPKDTRQEARMALLNAARSYSDTKGPFAPFAGTVVRNRLRDIFNREVRRVKTQGVSTDVADESGATILSGTPGEDDSRAGAEVESTRAILRTAIASLPDRLRRIIEARFTGQSLEEIGDRENLTKERVRQLEVNAREAIRGHLMAKGVKGLEGGVLASGAATDPEDEAAIAELMRELAREMPGAAIDDAQAAGAIEEPGEQTIGRPDLANPAGPDPESRRVVNAVDEARKETMERETHAQWSSAAENLIARDRAGVLRELLDNAREGVAIDNPIKVKAAQLLVNDLIQQAVRTKDVTAMQQAQVLAWSYREAGTEQARAFAARRDPFKRPADRYREFLAGAVFTPTPKLRAALKSAWSPGEKQRRVAALTKQLSDARAEVQNLKAQGTSAPADLLRRVSQLNVALGTARQQQDKVELLNASLGERMKRIEAELGKMGVTLDDVFGGEAYLRLRGSAIDNNIFDAANYAGIKRRVLGLIKKGWSNAYISNKTGLSSEQVADFEQEHIATLRARLEKLGDAALDVENLDTLNLAAGRAELASASALTPEERAKRIDEMIRAMGYGKSKQREQRTRRAGGRKVPTDTKPTTPAGGSAPGPVPGYPDTTGRTRPNKGNRQFDLEETGAEQPPDAGLPSTNGPTGDLTNDAADARRGPGATPEVPGTGRPHAEDFAGPDAAPPVFDISDPVHVAQMARTIQAIDGNVYDAAFEFWVNSVLSGPLTQGSNIIGNTANTAWDFTFQRFGEAALNAMVGNPHAPQAGEFKHMARAIQPAIAASWKLALRTWTAETSLFEHDVLGESLLLSQDDFDKTGGIKASISGQKGRVIRIPGRLLMAADDFFKRFISTVEASAQAYRIAKSEGLAGPDLEERIGGLINHVGSAAWQASIPKAKELTFQEDHKGTKIGDALQGLQSVRNKVPGLRYVLTFVRTPFNIFLQGLRKSPAGSAALFARFAHAGFYRIKDGKPIANTYAQPDQIKHVVEQLIAWTATALLYGAAAGDDDDEDKPILITGSVPYKDPASYALHQRAGNQSFTIRVGNVMVPYGKIEPLATMLGTTIDTIRGAKRGLRDGKGVINALMAAGGEILPSLASQAEEKTFLRGIGDLVSAAKGERKGERESYLANFLASWIPNLVRQPLHMIDPYVREGGGGFVDKLGKNIVPQTAEPKVDVYGEKITQPGLAAWRAFVPVNVRQAPEVNRVDRLLNNWFQAHPEEAWAPLPLTRTLRLSAKESRQLTGPELREYSIRAGRMAAQMLRNASLNVEHPTEVDLKRVQNAFSTARQITRRQMFGARASEIDSP